GTSRPSVPVRNPVSIGCWTSSLISTISPLAACSGTLTIATISGLPAGRRGDDHIRLRRPEAAIAHPGDGMDILGAVQPDPGLRPGDTGMRGEVEPYRIGQRVDLVEDRDGGDMVG